MSDIQETPESLLAAIDLGSNSFHLMIAKSDFGELRPVQALAEKVQLGETASAAIRGRFNVEVAIHPTDLSDGDAARALVETCRDMDILVNNAGAIPGGDIAAIGESTWREAWDLKVFGYVNTSRAAYENMKARGKGVIINVIGAAGERPSLRAARCVGSISVSSSTSAPCVSRGYRASSTLYVVKPDSRSNHRLPTMPWAEGCAPVASVACPTMVSVLACAWWAFR